MIESNSNPGCKKRKRRKKHFDRKKILQRARNAKYEMVGLGLLPLLLTVVLALAGNELAGELGRQTRSVGFTEASGQVVESDVITTTRKKKRPHHEARVRVRYFVGIEMETHLATLPGRAIPSSSVKETVAKLPLGAPITIYYNENDHSEIVLTRGLRGTDLYALMMFSCAGVLVFLAWLAFTNYALRIWRRGSRKRGSRRKKGIRWSRALTLAGGVYAIPLIAIIIEEPYDSNHSSAWVGGIWIVFALLSAFVFAASVAIDKIIIVTSPPRFNSSSDRAARVSP